MQKNVDDAFESFLRRLKPTATEHKKVRSHKKTVHNCLKNKLNCRDFFDIGSYGNGTAVRHFSDTDYFAILPSVELHNDSKIALRDIKKALQTTFSTTQNIKVKSPVVQIPFGQYASETMEITPCCFRGLAYANLANNKSFPRYLIPNGNNTWLYSSPKAHNFYVGFHNKRLNGKLKPCIRFIKAWKYYNNVPIHSFYLELRATMYAESKRSILFSSDIANFFRYLYDEQLNDILDPMGVSGTIEASNTWNKKQDALSKLSTAVVSTKKVVELEKRGKTEEAIELWHRVFNGNFKYR
jgi:hypothetical protein